MEENKKAVENESKKISEENLEEVAGGNDTTGWACFFEPQKPFVTFTCDGVVWAKCKNKCFNGWNMCGCHGSVFCDARNHMLEQSSQNPQRWHPAVLDHRGHATADKTIEPMTPRS